MKNLFLALIIFAFCLPASAQSRRKVNSTKSKMTFSKTRESLKGFSLVGYWSTANRLPIKANGEGITAKSESAFGLGAQYQYDMSHLSKSKRPISVIGGMVYETPRNLRSINDNGNVDEFSTISDPSFSMLLLYTNVDYRINKSASFFGGMNFPLPFESDFGAISLSGTPGFQGGISFDVAQSVQTDISYRWINLKGNNGLNRIDVDGLVLQGRYIF